MSSSCKVGRKKLMSVNHIDTMKTLEDFIPELLSTILRKATSGTRISVFTHTETSLETLSWISLTLIFLTTKRLPFFWAPLKYNWKTYWKSLWTVPQSHSRLNKTEGRVKKKKTKLVVVVMVVVSTAWGDCSQI